MLQKNSVVVQKTDVMGSEIDGEVVLLNIETSRYYGIEEIGSRIWRLIEKPCTVESVCTQLQAIYDVDSETCETEVLGFLNSLYSEKLIDVQVE